MNTQPQTKYHGADTSKERLEEVRRNFEHAAVEEWPGSLDFLVRDLLAMIEERDAEIELLQAEKSHLKETQSVNIILTGGGNNAK